MNPWKKIASNTGIVALGLGLVLGLTGCGQDLKNNQQSKNHTAQTVSELDSKPVRVEEDFNFGWRFKLQSEQSLYTGESMPITIDYDDSDWRNVRLPHDWSIALDYTQEKTAGATGYLPGGHGWYRKRFQTPQTGNITKVLFDGIYNHSKVWVNGELLGERPYGYVPIAYDLSEHLYRDGRENIITVYIDRSRYIDSRWYTGSGIYRNVKLITTNDVHIPIYGTYITTPEITSEHAKVKVEVEVDNRLPESQSINLLTRVYDDSGELVAENSANADVSVGINQGLKQDLNIVSPKLWDIDTPHLYTAKTQVKIDGKTVDEYLTKFGVRSFKNDPKTGFYLNGRNIKIKGANLHHDAGLVGAAVPKGVWKRRLALLKQAGVNAIRTAHNPASREFLELCDEMGFLVQAEAFDEWNNPKDKRKNFNQTGDTEHITESYSSYFGEWAERDLKVMLKRDRNHPSIFQWSVGNEIEWTYPRYGWSTGYWGPNKASEDINYYWHRPPFSIDKTKALFSQSETMVKGEPLAVTAQKLADWTRELDTSRPVTANLVIPSVSHFSGYADALDIIGYSYRQSVYEYGHEHYPGKMIYGSENWVQWHEWQAIVDKPYVPGIFVWTGADYLGESNGRWPKKGTTSGMLDFASFTKPSYHMMKTLWNDEPHLFITTQTEAKSTYQLDTQAVVDKGTGKVVEKVPGNWRRGKWSWHDVNQHWHYQQGEVVMVEVYSNAERVELLLNGKSLGEQSLYDFEDRIYKWAVPFEAGQLTARIVSEQGSDTIIESHLNTPNPKHQVQLSIDNTLLKSDGYDVAHLVAQVVDSVGNPVRHQEYQLSYAFEGDIKLLGVDNGASDNVQRHQSHTLQTSQGRALAIVQSNLNAGDVKVMVSGEGLTPVEQTITIQ